MKNSLPKVLWIVMVILVLTIGLYGCASKSDIEALNTKIDEIQNRMDKMQNSMDEMAIIVYATPSPTPNPTPTPTPTVIPYGRLSTLASEDMIDELISAGQDITKVVKYDENTDPNKLMGKPFGYVQKINFVYNGRYEGTVEVFTNTADATARNDYISSITQQSPILGYYTFQYDTVLFRLEYATPSSDADMFSNALDALNQW